MSDTDLCYLPASEAIKLFKAKKLSPVEVTRAVKEGNYRYQIFVQATGSDSDLNPYGLLLNCFAPGSPTKLEPEPKVSTP